MNARLCCAGSSGSSTGVDRVLDDDDVVDLGDDVRLRVVHTPGHTAGSVCFFWESGGTVFSGDAVQGHGWRAGMAPIYHDLTYVDSLGRIEGLDADVLCMGHTFNWGGVLNDPVRRGGEISATLQASRDGARRSIARRLSRWRSWGQRRRSSSWPKPRSASWSTSCRCCSTGARSYRQPPRARSAPTSKPRATERRAAV